MCMNPTVGTQQVLRPPSCNQVMRLMMKSEVRRGGLLYDGCDLQFLGAIDLVVYEE